MFKNAEYEKQNPDETLKRNTSSWKDNNTISTSNTIK